jgi:hypothetical protein
MSVIKSVHELEVRPPKDHRGVDLISDVLPFGRLWYDTPDHAMGYAMHRSRSHDAGIRVYDEAGNVIETHKHAGDFQRVRCRSLQQTDNFRRASERRPVRPTKTHASPPATDTPAVIAIAATKLPVRSNCESRQSRCDHTCQVREAILQVGPSAGCFWTSECLGECEKRTIESDHENLSAPCSTS